MENKKNNELNISDLLNILRARWLVLLIAGIIAAALAFGYSKFFVIPQYRASAQMIVDARNDESTVITNSQLSTAKQLVITYAEVIKNNIILNPVIDELGLDESYNQLYSKVRVEVVEDTQILEIYVTDEDPDKALSIVKKIVEVTPVVLSERIPSSKIASINDPTATSSPVSPNVSRNTILGFIVGVAIIYIYYFVKRLFDNKLKSADDIQRLLDLPVLGVIPSLERISSK